jgi:NAD(P)-dependent dehydrogenase (short-subunit alcohol dehydrogenase family)
MPLLEQAATAEDPARVINIGSIAGIRPQVVPTYGYDASKAAIHMVCVSFFSSCFLFFVISTVRKGGELRDV